jgi:molecular chaperone GrpE
MSENKHSSEKPQAAELSFEKAEKPDNEQEFESRKPVGDEAESEQLLELRRVLADSEAKAAENLDGWQRALAEFQNYKKRIERDRESDQLAMKGDLIRKFLPVLDDLQRALENRSEDDVWANGIDLIRRKLESILQAEGIQRMEADGALFDPNFHEALSQEPAVGTASGHVIAVVQQGYMLGDRVIRPALVRVAK